jgi:hypothetical protein
MISWHFFCKNKEIYLQSLNNSIDEKQIIQPQVPKKPTYGETTLTLILPQVLKKSTYGRIFHL